MADSETKSNEPQSPTTPGSKTTSVDAGKSEIQERFDRHTEQGFRGVEVDPTPNENYSVQGVTSGKPTPETDPKAAAAAKKVLGGK